MLYSAKHASDLISCLIKKPQLMLSDEVNLLPSDFIEPKHRISFFIIYNMFFQGIENITKEDVAEYIATDIKTKVAVENHNVMDFMVSVADQADVANFKYYYNTIKKFAILRDYKTLGVDISAYYNDDMTDIGLLHEVKQRFDQATPEDIMRNIHEEIAEVESRHASKTSFKHQHAADGLRRLLDKLAIEPEMGYQIIDPLLSTVVRGARRKKLYLMSGNTGSGKSRFAIKAMCDLSIPIKRINNKWVFNGANEKSLLVVNELEADEIQTIMLAAISGIDEDKILKNNLSSHEKEVLEQTICVIEHFKSNIVISMLPDPSITQLQSQVRRLALKHDIDNLFYDYIATSPSLVAEYGSVGVREDVALGMLSNCLKNLANELNIFVWSGTQYNAKGIDAEFIDTSCLRGSKAIADKIDVGIGINTSTKELFQQLSSNYGLQINVKFDLYKNRRGRTDVSLYGHMDLGTMTFKGIFIETRNGEQIQLSPMVKEFDPSELDSLETYLERQK